MSEESPKRIRKAAPKWTKEELETLKRLYSAERLPMKEIASIMGRSSIAVRLKANRTIPESNLSSGVDPQIISKVIDGYHRNDTQAKIGIDANVGQKTVRLILRRAGLKKRKKYDVVPVFSKEIVAEIGRLYLEEKMTQSQIARKLDLQHKSVQTILASRGFQTKPEWWSDLECEKLIELLKTDDDLWSICAKLNKTDLQVISCAKFLNIFDAHPVLNKRLSGKEQELIYFINVKISSIKNFDKNKFNTESTLTINDVFRIYNNQGGKCFYTGDELQLMASCENSLSVDRIDSQLPHRIDNIVLCTWESNQMKQDMSVKKFISVSQKIASRTEEIRESLKELSRQNQQAAAEHSHP
jgi:hypothetical protein